MPTVRNLKLDASGDLCLDGGQLATVSDGEAIAQALRCRLAFFLGEWFADLSVGLPYYQSILVKNPNLDAVREFYRDAIESTSGVVRVTSINLTYPERRKLAVQFTATTDFGELTQAVKVGV